MKTTGNTILITGSTSGIGLGLALRFHQAGNKVIIAGRRVGLLDRITTDHPGIEAIKLDVADAKSIISASELVAARYPDLNVVILNVVINNAGIMPKENPLEQDSLKLAEETVAVNLLGTIRTTYAFLPQLAAKADSVIINVSSALAFVPFPATLTYCATKAAVHSFSESLRVRLVGTSVQVIELAPRACAPSSMAPNIWNTPCPWTNSWTRHSPFCTPNPHPRKSSWNVPGSSVMRWPVAVTTGPWNAFCSVVFTRSPPTG